MRRIIWQRVWRAFESLARGVTILHVNFAAVLDRVDAVLAVGGWRSAVVGGVALAACGHPRLTLDLDMVTESAAQDTMVSSLEAEGYAGGL